MLCHVEYPLKSNALMVPTMLRGGARNPFIAHTVTIPAPSAHLELVGGSQWLTSHCQGGRFVVELIIREGLFCGIAEYLWRKLT
jgi:hypothetical protein